MSPIISVRNLGKAYTLRHQVAAPYATLRETISNAARSVARRLREPTAAKPAVNATTEQFWAVDDISFDIEPGQRVGIIGRNGAGKSTLLKLLSRVTEPSTGSIRLRGRVASLLEVGTGFHPELTGRENIFLNGVIMGMSRKEIRRKFDEIVAFAEIDRFLDTPVKRYSSGMYVRLAFAVAAHLEPDILVIDEVLAVGDAQFQDKCLGKMEDVGRSGRTVLFVSHSMGAVGRLCERALVLRDGRLGFDGPVDAAIREYMKTARGGKVSTALFSGTLGKAIEIDSVCVNGLSQDEEPMLSPNAPIEIRITGQAREDVPSFRFSFAIFREGIRLFTMHDTSTPQFLAGGAFEASAKVPPSLLRPGTYSLALGGYRDGASEWFFGRDILMFQIIEEWTEENEFANAGLINVPFTGARRAVARAGHS
jgi:lipopolysaccharide transport system ATP-binding protein